MKAGPIASAACVAALVALATTGCAGRKDADGDSSGLAEAEATLIEDDNETSDVEADLEAGLEEPLSGAAESDPGSPADPAAPEAEQLDTVRTNPGKFFKPAGCITTTVDGNVATHVFTDCTGPYGLRSFNGTVTSTWTRADGKLTVQHEARGFRINGATVDHVVTVQYTKQGSVWTKTRHGESSGTTAAGRPISHRADYVTTYDTAARCITRDGSSSTTIGDRGVERTISDYERCGIGRLGCPDSGHVEITRKGANLTLKLDFVGGRDVKVTRPNGAVITRQLFCNPRA